MLGAKLANITADQVEIVHCDRVCAASAVNFGAESLQFGFEHHLVHANVEVVCAEGHHQTQLGLLQFAESVKAGLVSGMAGSQVAVNKLIWW